MQHVFLSYSRTDADWVGRLRSTLHARDVKTWIDHRDIPATLPWLEEAQRAIVEASLFVMCDSPAARASAPCAAETRIAFDAAKASVRVDVGTGIGHACDTIVAELRRLGSRYRTRTELAVGARDWDEAGRPAGALPGSRRRWRLRRSLSRGPELNPVEAQYLRASRARSVRRTATSALVIAVGGGALVTIEVLNLRSSHLKSANREQAAIYGRGNDDRAAGVDDPYLGLSAAAARGDDESAVGAIVIETAFRKPVPDDAFRLPSGTRQFVARPVGSHVVVGADDGRAWARPAAGGAVRPFAARLPRTRAGGLTATIERGSSLVSVRREGRLWRRVTFNAPPNAVSISPDGRELAAAIGSTVVITPLATGVARTSVFGRGGDLRDVAWSADGNRVWALDSGLALSWRVHQGTRLVDDPQASFQAVMPARRDGAAWVADDDGSLLELDLDDGQVLRRLEVPDRIRSAAADASGAVAAVSGERGIWIVPLEGGRRRLISARSCSPGRAAFVDASTFLQPCLHGALMVVSVPEGRITGALPSLGPAGVFAATPLRGSGAIVASDDGGRVFVHSGGGWKMLWASQCGASTVRIAASADGTRIAPAGSGTGLLACTRRGVLVGDDPTSPQDWRFDAVNDVMPTAHMAQSAAFSRSGRVMVYAYADGTIVAYPSDNIMPRMPIADVDGAVRDLYVTAADDLIAVTDRGIVQRVRLCDSCVSNRALAAVARRRLRASGRLGLARPVGKP